MNRLGLFLFVLTAAVYTAGCSAMQWGRAGIAREIVNAQRPGVATGAGATITGPTNSAAPTTQVAERRANYFPPDPYPVGAWRQFAGKPASTAAEDSPLQPQAAASYVPAQPVASMYERTETTFGQHQSASAVIQAAAKLDGFNKIQWVGLLLIVGSVAALLWSAGHNEGYPVIYWKCLGLGVFFLFCDNPLWLLLLLIPAGFYAVQRFGLWKFPP